MGLRGAGPRSGLLLSVLLRGDLRPYRLHVQIAYPVDDLGQGAGRQRARLAEYNHTLADDRRTDAS